MGKEIKNGNNSKGNCRKNVAREEQGGSYIFSQNAQFLWRVTNPMLHPKTMNKNKKTQIFRTCINNRVCLQL